MRELVERPIGRYCCYITACHLDVGGSPEIMFTLGETQNKGMVLTNKETYPGEPGFDEIVMKIVRCVYRNENSTIIFQLLHVWT